MHKMIIIRLCHLRGHSILPLISNHKVESQEGNDNDEQDIAAHVGRESDEVARRITRQENLGADGISHTPRDEVHRHDSRLLSLSRNVASQ